MDRYFHKLFDVLEEAQAEDKTAPIERHDSNADESQATYHGFSHFIKPDMIMNIYSLVDFWMNRICEYQRNKKSLSLGSKDIKGNSDLHALHKYLTKYAGLNLSAVQTSYKQLDDLRKVRNTFIHGGGHVQSDQEVKFSAIKGIVLSDSLICIEDDFVWISLEHAKKYLNAATLA